MKKILITAVVGLAVAVAAFAALPTFKTVSGYGNATTGATVYFPADPNSQVRIVNVNYASDSNTAALNFASGTTPFYVTATNVATSSVTNQINSTNGLTAGGVLVLQHNGTCYSSTISTWNQTTNSGPYGGTNVVLASGGWGVATSVYDEVELMSAARPIPVGATTNAINGDAIFVGNYGRIVSLQLTPALVTNRIYTASAHYDSQSQ